VVVVEELDDVSLELLSELDDEPSELEVGMVTTGLFGATIWVGVGDGAAGVGVGVGAGVGAVAGWLVDGGGDPLGDAACWGAAPGGDETPDGARGAVPCDADFEAAGGDPGPPVAPLAMVVTGAEPDPGAGTTARPTGADAGSDAGADVPRPMDATDAASRAKARNPT
jgi:hypothetical protein